MRILHVVSVINLVIIGVLSHTQIRHQETIVNVELSQELHNEGFHRILTYDIVFPVNSEHDEKFYNGCNISLHQPLPAGVYVNEDELLELRAMKRLRAGVIKPVNIELPAEEASPIDVYMIGTVVDSALSLWLPVHARYHRAKPGGCGADGQCGPENSFVRITIEKPDLLIRCPVKSEDGKPFDNADMDIYEKYLDMHFKHLPYKKMTPQINWDVPIGNTDDYKLVATVTMLTIVIGSMYLLNTLHEYKMKRTIGPGKKDI